MKRDIATLKGWFQTNDKPTEEQFGDWLDSFVHKDATVIITGVSQDIANYILTFSDSTMLTVRKALRSGVGLLNFEGKGKNGGVQNENMTIYEPGDFASGQPYDNIIWARAMYLGDVAGGGSDNMDNWTGLISGVIEVFPEFP